MKAAHGGFVIIQKSCLLLRILEFLIKRWDIRIQFFFLLYSLFSENFTTASNLCIYKLMCVDLLRDRIMQNQN